MHLRIHSARCLGPGLPAGLLQIRLWIWVDCGRGSALIWSPQPGRMNAFLSLLLDRPSLQRTAHLSRKRSHLRYDLCLFTLTWAKRFLLCEVTSIDWQVPPIQTRFLFQAGSAQIGQARFTRAFTVFSNSIRYSTNSGNLGSLGDRLGHKTHKRNLCDLNWVCEHAYVATKMSCTSPTIMVDVGYEHLHLWIPKNKLEITVTRSWSLLKLQGLISVRRKRTERDTV